MPWEMDLTRSKMEPSSLGTSLTCPGTAWGAKLPEISEEELSPRLQGATGAAACPRGTAQDTARLPGWAPYPVDVGD